MKKLKAVLNHVVVKRDEQEQTSKGGIMLPDQVKDKEKPQRGTVVDVGPGRWLESGVTGSVAVTEELDLAPHDVVWFRKFMGTEIELPDGKYLVLTAEDILAVEIDDED